MGYKIISVDFQKEFTSSTGDCYRRRPSVDFVKNILTPFLKERKIMITEIISDYRQPRSRGDKVKEQCVPGTDGYISEIPDEIKNKNIWVKCENSPVWIRENIGLPEKKPGLPYQDSKAFNEWLKLVVGKPNENNIILIGLTLDCCVLCTAQELSFRGYKVKILREAVDVYSGSQEEKNNLLENRLFYNWTRPISWEEVQNLNSFNIKLRRKNGSKITQT
jgi:nicotinamidase-related amidase